MIPPPSSRLSTGSLTGSKIVQSHFRGWKFQAADAVADWALHGMLLVGEPQSVDRFDTDLVSQLKHFTVE